METLEYKHEDKSEWGEGPWQSEPDKIQWQDPNTGMPCLIVRGPSGALCGYVGVSKGHPYFEKEYYDVLADVHYGLTFAGKCQADPHGICHKVSEGEDDNVWWLGFDCAHLGDYCPGSVYRTRFLMRNNEETYKDISFVKAEVESLAKQLKAMWV